MRAILRWTAVTVLILGATSCSDAVSPGAARSRLEVNRQRWIAQQMTRYDFTLEQFCFCLVRGPVRVSVQNGSVVAATEISTGHAVDIRFVRTIESLFEFIDNGIEHHAVVLEVTYDPVMGYPTKITFDGAFNIADDEITYEVSDVARVAPASSSSRRP